MPLCRPEIVALASEASLVANVRKGRTGETSVAEAHVASPWVATAESRALPKTIY